MLTSSQPICSCSCSAWRMHTVHAWMAGSAGRDHTFKVEPRIAAHKRQAHRPVRGDLTVQMLCRCLTTCPICHNGHCKKRGMYFNCVNLARQANQFDVTFSLQLPTQLPTQLPPPVPEFARLDECSEDEDGIVMYTDSMVECRAVGYVENYLG